MIRRLFVAGLLGFSLVLAPPVSAEDDLVVEDEGTTARVPGDPEATLRQSFGAPEGAVQSVPLRFLPDSVDEAAESTAVRDDRVSGEGDVPVTQVALVDDGVRWAFVLAGGMLTVARTHPDYVFLDALSVQNDPGGFPMIERVIALGPGSPGVLVANAHFNSQEGFAAYTLLAVVDGRLRPVWDGPLLYSLNTGDDTCDVHRIEQRLSRFHPSTESGAAGWPDIDVGFGERVSCEKDGRVEQDGGREFAITLHFDTATGRYAGALADLEALNAERRGE